MTWVGSGSVREIGVKEVTGARNRQISTVRMSDDVNLGPSGNTRNHSGAEQWIGKLRGGIAIWNGMMCVTDDDESKVSVNGPTRDGGFNGLTRCSCYKNKYRRCIIGRVNR